MDNLRIVESHFSTRAGVSDTCAWLEFLTACLQIGFVSQDQLLQTLDIGCDGDNVVFLQPRRDISHYPGRAV